MPDEAEVKMNPKLNILIPVIRGLSKILGRDYEVNLHDVSIPERSLVLCENGYVTGRSAGGPMTDFGLFMLQSEEYRGKEGIFNYLAKNNRGELIKCSCIFIRDEDGKIIAFLCINYDLKRALAAKELIESLAVIDAGDVEQYTPASEKKEKKTAANPALVRESFAQDIEEVMGDSLAQLRARFDKPLKYLTKPEKKDAIKELYDKGFFLLKGSVDAVASEMGNTKFTIYAYIRDVQKNDAESARKI